MSSTLVKRNEIRPAHLPIYCSACHGQSPQLRHVDFDAAVDRGWYGDQNASTGIVMDDLILCENCLKEGARLVGMGDVDTLEAENKELEKRLKATQSRFEKAAEYADKLEDAMDKRPSPVRPKWVGRPPKKPSELLEESNA